MADDNSRAEPDHDQTVAALGRFRAILKAIESFLHDPKIAAEQRKWAQQQFQQTEQAQIMLLDDHAAAYPLTPEEKATSIAAHLDATKH